MKHVSLLTSTAAIIVVCSAPSLAQNSSSFIDTPKNSLSLAPTVSAQLACDSLNQKKFDDIALIKAVHISATTSLPAYCHVSGYIKPEIKFEISLPDVWNRRLYMFGNGGYAGENLASASRIATRDVALAQGFLTVQQNTGHDAVQYDLGDFVDGGIDKLIDYASRGVHVTVNTAKSMANTYYEKYPAFSYWDGCSTGGRQGLMAAQRHPGDFDGIIAGAPVLNFTDTQLWGVWNARALEKAPISKAQLPVLAKAVMAKCDAVDGLEDGLITDPRKCDFNPVKDLKICEADGEEECFTNEQVQALSTIANGVMIKGKEVFPGVPWGVEGVDHTGESGWNRWIVNEDGPSRQLQYGETFLRNMAMIPASGKSIDWRTFDFDNDFEKIQAIRNILDATSPDLSEFKKRGGRMISYFGLADPALNPVMGINYYESVREEMGIKETEDFYRFFNVPGMYHCRGGYGTDTFDAFTPLMNWVENGIAPDVIQATQIQDNAVVRSRPLCPYPQVAEYTGSGDVNDGTNFKCVMTVN